MSDNGGRSRRAQRAIRREQQKRRRVIAAVAGVVALAAIVGVVIAAAGGGGDGSNETVAELDLFEFGISGDLEMPAGSITLSATNIGAIPHNVGLRGFGITNEVGPGGSAELELGEVPPGTYELYCDIVGHEDAGMVADFTVT